MSSQKLVDAALSLIAPIDSALDCSVREKPTVHSRDTPIVACRVRSAAVSAEPAAAHDRFQLPVWSRFWPFGINRMGLVAQIFPRWNPLTSWMRQIEDLQRAA